MRGTGDAAGRGNLAGVVGLNHHVGGFNGGIRAQATHRNAHVGQGHHGRVVHPVTHEGQLAALAQVLLHVPGLVFGQQPTVGFGDAQFLGHALHDAVLIAGEHDELGDAVGFQLPDGLGRVLLRRIGHGEVAGVLPVDSGHHDAVSYLVYFGWVADVELA